MKFLLASLILVIGALEPSSAFVTQRLRSVSHSQSELSANRKPFITGNWKLNPDTRQEAVELATGVANAVGPSTPGDVAIFVPFPFLEAVQKTVGDKLIVGAEMITPEEEGAFTGGISAQMIKSMGINWALAGHSERRTINKESDEYINSQCCMLIKEDMNVVLCIGETNEEFENNLVRGVCEVQLRKGLAGISPHDMNKVTIAYEPVWAIGTGKVATPEIAQNVHALCRAILADMYGPIIAKSTRILYGGSVSPESVDGLLAKPDIDGALVGGASLDAAKFARIINFVPAEAAVSV